MTLPVVFTDTLEVSPEYSPRPATEFLPDWYKRTPEYMSGERKIVNGNTPHSIKKCIPVFDALTAGYIIPTYVDVQVTLRNGLSWYEWPPVAGVISFHPVDQAPLHPGKNGLPYPKWANPWSIKTPPGYSCLFIPPMHNPNGIFKIMPGVVDTDTYAAPVNFPFVLDDPQWEGLIPAGTPMVQVVPFRRDQFKMALGNATDLAEQNRVTRRLRSVFFNSYKRQFWSRKEYR